MRTIRELMTLALEREASDLHLVAGTPPCLRIHGAIHFLEDGLLQGDQIREMVQEILSPAQLERLDSELELEFSYTEPSLGRFRAALFFERANLAAAFRVVPLKVRSVHDLKLPTAVHDLARRQAGLVLIAGATGQGKTTTMNAMIDLINSERRARIITIEDPIEFVHRHRRSVILQREVESDTHSFNRALISALRQDPNVICIGEMRDLETIGTALTAAETRPSGDQHPAHPERLADHGPHHRRLPRASAESGPHATGQLAPGRGLPEALASGGRRWTDPGL